MHSEETWLALETFLHTLYYYGYSAHLGLGIVLLARVANVSPIEMLARYRASEVTKAQVDEILRTRP
jgi:hypothetical protein